VATPAGPPLVEAPAARGPARKQVIASVARTCLGAGALFGLFAMKARDPAVVIYSWPGALMITASACALVAAALNVVTLLALPAIWRGGRRVDSWNQLRKLGFTLTTLIYGALAVVLALWGALSPWGG